MHTCGIVGGIGVFLFHYGSLYSTQTYCSIDLHKHSPTHTPHSHSHLYHTYCTSTIIYVHIDTVTSRIGSARENFCKISRAERAKFCKNFRGRSAPLLRPHPPPLPLFPSPPPNLPTSQPLPTPLSVHPIVYSSHYLFIHPTLCPHSLSILLSVLILYPSYSLSSLSIHPTLCPHSLSILLSIHLTLCPSHLPSHPVFPTLVSNSNPSGHLFSSGCLHVL